MPAAAEPKAMGGIVKNNRVYLAVGAITIALASAACGSSAEKATSTTSTSTTSTTLAIALPADQLSQQARGIITLNELGAGWSLKPTGVNDFDTLAKSAGFCNGPNLIDRMAGYNGRSWFEYTKSDDEEASLSIFAFSFPTEDTARTALAANRAVFDCGTYEDEDGRGTSAVLPDLKVGDESFARSGSFEAGSQYCNAGETFSVTHRVGVRVGATVFLIDRDNFTPDCGSVGAPDTEELFEIATKAITKFEAELKQYTKEYYANLATTTTTRAAKTSD